MRRGSDEVVTGDWTFKGKVYGDLYFKLGANIYKFGKWYDYSSALTTQGFGTVSAVKAIWKREGGSCKGMVKFTSGTATAVEARVGLPPGVLSDSALIPSIMLANGIWDNASANYGAASQTPVVFIESGVGYVTFGVLGTTAGLTKLNGNGIMSAGQVMALWFELPVSGWN